MSSLRKIGFSHSRVKRVAEILWPARDPHGMRVFALLDGARNQRIFGAVDAARVDKTCLYSVHLRWPGEDLPWNLIGAAPYLVELERESDLTGFLLSQGWHDHWGVFCRARADLKSVRRHFREMLVVRDQGGRRFLFRYYDPRVLRLYLPSCKSDELRTVFGPVDSFVLPAGNADAAILYRFEGSRLLHRIFELEGAAPQELPSAPAIAARAVQPAKRRISFIVTARDEAPAVLETTINGLLETSAQHNAEILLIDDASVVPIALQRPRLRVIRNQEPRGVAQSRRHGASLANGDVLVWSDAHMRFAPDWLERLLEHVDSGAFLCAAWWNYELSRPVCWGGEYVWSGERNYQAGRSPGFSFRHLTKFPGPGAVEVPLAVGACYMALRRSYEKMGGFSPFFRVWGKCEQDISARAWITGVGIKCVTEARVGHLSRSSFPYPVRWSDIEFNQISMVRTTFEDATVQAIESLIKPLPAEVQEWLDGTNFGEWRARIQSRRTMSDADFFRRFVPNAPAVFLRS